MWEKCVEILLFRSYNDNDVKTIIKMNSVDLNWNWKMKNGYGIEIENGYKKIIRG